MDTYTLYFDGCSKGNPGLSGAGAVLFKNNEEIWSKAYFVGHKQTNNYAEYTGLLIGLQEAVKKSVKNLIVRGDSMLVIKQMNGEYKMKSKNLKELYENVKKLEKSFEKITYIHVYRDKNKRADQLSNIGLTKM